MTDQEKAYRGYGTGRYVTRPDGEALYPGRSQKVVNHSPDGYEWGYGGSGPAQLALAILLDHTDDEQRATRHYQAFKWTFVVNWERFKDWSVTTDVIEAWLAAQEAT